MKLTMQSPGPRYYDDEGVEVRCSQCGKLLREGEHVCPEGDPEAKPPVTKCRPGVAQGALWRYW